MRNKYKVTIMIGAGCTLPYLPELSTLKITDFILNNSSIETLLSFLNKIYVRTGNSLKAGLSFEAIGEFILQVSNAIKETKRIKNIDFEDIIYIWDKAPYLVQKDIIPSFSIREKLLSYVLTKSHHLCISGIENPFFWNFISYIPNIVRHLILNYIIHKKDQNEEERFIKDFKDFIRNLENNYEYINIDSLNYDCLLSEALKETDFVNGFKDEVFNKKHYFDSKKTLSFIHGHMGFFPERSVYHSNSICHPNDAKIRFTYDYEKAISEREKWILDSNESGINLTYDNEVHFNIFMVSGKDKSYSFTNEPFASYYQKFFPDLKETNLLIIIGYSLRDSHINTGWTGIKRINPNLRVIFVDNKAFNPNLSYNHPLISILDDMKFTVQMKATSIEFPAKDQLFNGFYSINPKKDLFYFERGTEDFLRNIEEVLRTL